MPVGFIHLNFLAGSSRTRFVNVNVMPDLKKYKCLILSRYTESIFPISSSIILCGDNLRYQVPFILSGNNFRYQVPSYFQKYYFVVTISSPRLLFHLSSSVSSFALSSPTFQPKFVSFKVQEYWSPTWPSLLTTAL